MQARQSEIRSYFQIEARELIDTLTLGVAQLDGSAPHAEQVQRLERAAHTLKGAAHVVGEPEIARLAHDFEDALADYRREPGTVRARDLLVLVDQLAASTIPASQDPAGPQELDAQPAVHSAAAGPAGSPAAGIPARGRMRSQPATISAAHQQPSPPASAPKPHSSTLRVDLKETERLLNHVSETSRLASSMQAVLDQLDAQQNQLNPQQNHVDPQPHTDRAAAFAGVFDTLRSHLNRLEREADELYRIGSQLRLVSSETLLIEAGRVVRATAASQGKRVDCVTRGDNERIDIKVLEALESALLHLLRNAVAHGIESEAERQRQGKPAGATILVELTRSGNVVRLACSDDGRGIDLDRIRTAAVDQQLYTPEQAADCDRAELLSLLFRPGFSTSAATDQISGRGIGLDAVRDAVGKLGGTIAVESTPGEGTTFTVELPQTLVAVRALEVVAGGRHYAIPLSAVEQTFLLARHHKTGTRLEQGGSTLFDGKETMPLLRLSDAFPAVGPPAAVLPGPGLTGSALPASGARPGRPALRRSASQSAGFEPQTGGPGTPKLGYRCIVLRTETSRAALAVDLLGELRDLLVRPLPAFLGALPVIAGASLTSAGEPLLVLDAGGLMRAAQASLSGAAPVTGDRSVAAVGPILVIDDSLTTRTLEQSILENEGFEVDLATSAEEALELARRRRYALFLVDVEMPGMNGFEFVRTVQADPDLRRTPSIMVTSLNDAASREQGRSAGAESYIVKGEFQQKVFLDRIRAVIGSATAVRRSGA